MTISLVLATRNRDKIKEIKRFLEMPGLNIQTLDDRFPDAPIVREDGCTIEENAKKKATVIAKHTNRMCLADDTCLEIDALNGEPGVYSSRYAGENATYRDNIIKVLEDLKEVPLNRRKARFRCVMVIAHKDAIIYQAEGVCNGTILMEPRGDRGFGYDPLFVPDNEILTFAEMDLAKKNLISHRGKALKQIKDVIESNYI